MKKNNKAFTLIELLAIIVILAIIAVITVPVILNIIENARKGAAQDSAYGFKDSISKYYVTKLSEIPNYNFTEGSYTISKDGSNTKITLKTDNDDYHNIQVSGTIPNGGWITIEKNAVKEGQVQIGEYCVVINNGTVGEATKETCPSEKQYSPTACDNPNLDIHEDWFAFDSTTGTITGFSDSYINGGEYSSDLIIPCQIDGVDVKTIGEEAFFSDKYGYPASANISSAVKKIVVLDGAETIGNLSFELFEYFENLIIGNGVKDIGNEAFYHSQNLKNLTLGNSVQTIGKNAFTNGYDSLVEELVIPDSVTYIGEHAFYDWTNVKKLKLGSSLKTIGKEAFSHFSKIQQLELPSNLETIEEGAFYDLENLKELVIPNSVKTIGVSAFEFVPLESLTLGNNVETIGERAFASAPIENLIFGENLETIGDHAFANLKVHDLIIPDSVISIDSVGFDCSSITGILKTGNGLSSIGEINSSDGFVANTLILGTNISNLSNQNLSRVANIYYIGENVESQKSNLMSSILDVTSNINLGCDEDLKCSKKCAFIVDYEASSVDISCN